MTAEFSKSWLSAVGILFLTLMGGCAAHGPFYAAQGFTDDQKAQIARAAAEWERVGVPVDIVWDVDPGIYHSRSLKRRPGPPPVFKGEHDPREIPHYGLTSDRTYMNGETVTIQLWPDELEPQIQYRTALHEFGHALGIPEHSTVQGTVMYPMMQQAADCLTTVDVQLFCRDTGCDESKLSPCQGDEMSSSVTPVVP
jgi:hypothetical protein